MKTGTISLPQAGKISPFKFLIRADLEDRGYSRIQAMLRLEGQNYLMRNDDAIHIRHNG